METKQKKPGKLDIDEDYDLRLVKTWNPALRWLLTLPTGLIAMLIIQLAYGFIVRRILSNFDGASTVSIIVNCFFLFAKYAMFVVAMTATTPVARAKKKLASIICAIIAAIILCGSTLLLVHFADSINQTMMISTVVASLLGILFGVWHVSTSTSKPLEQK